MVASEGSRDTKNSVPGPNYRASVRLSTLGSGRDEDGSTLGLAEWPAERIRSHQSILQNA